MNGKKLQGRSVKLPKTNDSRNFLDSLIQLLALWT